MEGMGTWYDQAEKVQTNGTDSHVRVQEEGHHAHTIEYDL